MREKETDIFTIDALISKEKLTNHFPKDTEDDPLSQKPATLQVEFINQTSLSVIII
jgi:hypothetical protein